MGLIDPDQLRYTLPCNGIGERKVELPTARRRRNSRFIPPMPFEWFRQACLLPGKAVILAVAIWYLSKRQQSTTILLAQTTLHEFGISRQAKYRALPKLQAAGLITVQSRGRKNPQVTILTPPV
jgi:hypothetical protein